MIFQKIDFVLFKRCQNLSSNHIITITMIIEVKTQKLLQASLQLLYIHPSIHPSVRLSVCPSINSSIYPSIHPSIHPSVLTLQILAKDSTIMKMSIFLPCCQALVDPKMLASTLKTDKKEQKRQK